MQITEQVKKILSYYESDNPGTKTNLARILMAGKLGGKRVGAVLRRPAQLLARVIAPPGQIGRAHV